MGKFDALIPPGVELSPEVTAQILARALQDENGFFDPIKEPGRAVDVYKRTIAALKLEIDVLQETQDICNGIMNAVVERFVPPGAMTEVYVPLLDKHVKASRDLDGLF